MEMTVSNINRCLTSDPYSNGRQYFHLDQKQLAVIEKAEKAGYIHRSSQTQANWTICGLAKAKRELPA